MQKREPCCLMGHKRINNIYDQIYTYENLLKAYRKARKNKRYRTEVLAYTARLSENLLELQEDFKTCTYHPQSYPEIAESLAFVPQGYKCHYQCRNACHNQHNRICAR